MGTHQRSSFYIVSLSTISLLSITVIPIYYENFPSLALQHESASGSRSNGQSDSSLSTDVIMPQIYRISDEVLQDSDDRKDEEDDGLQRQEIRRQKRLQRQNRAVPRPLNISNTTPLIIYLHFHKAGGTSIVNAAKRTQNLFDPNGNGNPKFERGLNGTIKFWTYSEPKLIDFVSQCLHQNKATFIATENHWFLNTSIINKEFKRQNRIELVTQIRNPFARFVSNYFFDVKYHAIGEPQRIKNISLIQRLRRYHSCGEGSEYDVQCSVHWQAVNDWNMYVRVLTNQFDRNYNVTEQDLEIAKGELDKFDLVTVLEMPNLGDLWKEKYGMNIRHSNGNKKYNQIYAAERDKDEDFDEKFKKFEQEFKRWNHFDYLLYEYAREVAIPQRTPA